VCRLIKKLKDNPTTHTFCFQTVDLKPHAKFSKFFLDWNYYGKHYTVSASSDPLTIRMYTICNTLNPDFYQEIFKLLDGILKGGGKEFDRELFRDGPMNRVYLTMKNYNVKTGLSAKVHALKVNEGANTHMMDFKSSNMNQDRE
jgi:hypothetical protein